ncbi:hypothetical protein GGTG_01552 [Gaeumannomyces tritici R3-111a-1]|uniref:Uncharacterized protein n=1 Tax=Gaeumannomyces tritici (strain R3-111a-1) TaxID=644352 RepID=J3NJX0_GAET3|nr:hypothetical protein GGTG_01552 [Gaeumannomyces tritici R3-111a-1]EJT81574.1 hypothetical protein GGTG_01552 [Gaeumannomyces tritici R3-111a-1]
MDGGSVEPGRVELGDDRARQPERAAFLGGGRDGARKQPHPPADKWQIRGLKCPWENN